MAREGFHDVLFPVSVSLGARGGPRRNTEIVSLASGGEVRRSRWAGSRRAWDVGGGVASLADAEAVLAFFEAREGRRFAFRFRDPFDYSSAAGGGDPDPSDQVLGTGDGERTVFSLAKSYGSAVRPVDLAEAGSVRVAIDGSEVPPSDWSLAPRRDAIELVQPAPSGATVSAGFRFDVPVRFADDALVLQLAARGASLPAIRLMEVAL